jgi:type 1 glutamine amidotransferase
MIKKPGGVILLIFIMVFMMALKPCQARPAKRNPVIKVLLIDGQSSKHDLWKTWTPILLKQLDDADLFVMDVYTAPLEGEDMDGFDPDFKAYDVVVSTYAGRPWPEKTKKSFRKFVAGGGGLVIIHAANNAFPDWPEYNLMTGIGGWGGRDENCGSYIYVDDQGKLIRDDAPGRGGSHGKEHPFVVRIRDKQHPVTKGLPEAWMHVKDELYGQLRGPAVDMEVLATAYSSEQYEGSGRHEPVIMTISYKKGRIFHTTLGHSVEAISCVGFMTIFVRGCEWAATGKVTIPVSADFPDEHSTRSRQY